MEQFRGGEVEVTFVAEVLAVARFLISLMMIELHPKTPQKQKQKQPDAIHFFCTCHRASRGCEIRVI